MHDTETIAGSSTFLYVASRATEANLRMWRVLRDQERWPIISSWIDSDAPIENVRDLWEAILCEVRNATHLVLYAHEQDMPLKGAFVEAGMALALGKEVHVVIDRMVLDAYGRPIGSWIYHPSVHLHSNMYDVKRFLSL